MDIHASIFRAYDIRGTYPDQINEQSAYLLGRAFVAFLRRFSSKKVLRIGGARDSRISSPRLFKAFTRALREESCIIIDLGVASTPMLYFAVWKHALDGGFMITASHNPNPYNGVKLTRELGIPIGGATGLDWMKEYIVQGKIGALKERKGAAQKKDIEKEYSAFSRKLAGVKKNEFRGASIALDAGNGVGGESALAVLKEAGAVVTALCMKPDGNFPNHVPDPLRQENVRDLQDLLKKKTFSLGMALDGDADRIVFLCADGTPVRGDIVTALVAGMVGKNGEKILYDIRSSNIVPETIAQHGRVPVVSPIGHALIKNLMRKKEAVFAGEYTGHYYWGGGLFFETPYAVALLLLKAIKISGASLKDMIQPFLQYAYSGEINLEIHDKEKKIQALKERYATAKTTALDGFRADFPDWWFLARASHTEDVLRLVIEAKNPELLEARKQELLSFLMA